MIKMPKLDWKTMFERFIPALGASLLAGLIISFIALKFFNN